MRKSHRAVSSNTNPYNQERSRSNMEVLQRIIGKVEIDGSEEENGFMGIGSGGSGIGSG